MRPWTALVVTLVEARRIAGRPRQRMIAYIGTIRSSEITTLRARRRLWSSIDSALSALGPEIRQKCELALAARVPRPSAEEIAAMRPLTEIERVQKIEAASARLRAARGMGVSL